MRAGAERAEVTVEQVLREVAKIGFSDIRKAVAWRNEMVASLASCRYSGPRKLRCS
jgi:hypothetical protein